MIRKIRSLVLDTGLDMRHIRWRIHRQVLVIRHDVDEVRLLLGLVLIRGDGLGGGDQACGQDIGELHAEYLMQQSYRGILAAILLGLDG